MAPSDDVIVSPYLRASWGGDLGDPAIDIWSNTLKFFDFGDSVPDLAMLQPACDAAAVPLKAWFTQLAANGNAQPGSLIGKAASLRYLKLTWVGEHGLQRDLETPITEFPSTTRGTELNLPIWEQTYAITLRAAASRGRAHAGRFFPPVSGGPPEGYASPYIGAVSAAAMASAATTLLFEMRNAINASFTASGMADAGFVPGVISPGSVARGTTEKRAAYVRVVVDRVPDIQHRRVNRVPRLEGQFYDIP